MPGRVWKAFRVTNAWQPRRARPYTAEAFLLDAPARGNYGGSGKRSIGPGRAESNRKSSSPAAWTPRNVGEAIQAVRPWGVDACSRLESSPGRKDHEKMRRFIEAASGGIHMIVSQPDATGHFGPYGGRFVPEVLMAPLEELEHAYLRGARRPGFQAELDDLLENYAGRPTPLYFAKRLSETLGGARIYLKREDLLHTGAHKINNCLGQALLARRMGKKRIIAETGAGQHGVATATVCALFGLECVVYMGEEDMRRQRLNVFRMRLLGAKVVGVTNGSRTLKDAISEAMRDWVTNVDDHVLPARLGARRASVPDDGARFPSRHRRRSARARFSNRKGRLPDRIFACVGGGSNAIGMFHPFLQDSARAADRRRSRRTQHDLGEHAARFAGGSPGVLHGTFSYLLQDDDGQVSLTHSVSAGLDYASVGPEHAMLHDQKRAEYLSQ